MTCSETPRIAYMDCQSKGRLSVKEPVWKDFALIPREKAPGVDPIKTINQCDAD